MSTLCGKGKGTKDDRAGGRDWWDTTGVTSWWRLPRPTPRTTQLDGHATPRRPLFSLNNLLFYNPVFAPRVNMPVSTTTTTTHPLPLYEITDVPGKGLGAIARTKIPKGTRITVEEPLFLMDSYRPSQIAEFVIASQLHKLSEDKRKAFLSLANAFPDHEYNSLRFSGPTPCRVEAVRASVARMNTSAASTTAAAQTHTRPRTTTPRRRRSTLSATSTKARSSHLVHHRRHRAAAPRKAQGHLQL